MFILDQIAHFKRVVKLKVPDDRGFSKASITVTFKVLPISRLAEIEKQTTSWQQDLLQEVIVDVTDLQNALGEAIDYDQEVKATLIDVSFIRVALLESYQNALAGVVEKN